MVSDAIGAILTGGESRRMGSDKANVELVGKPMVAWVAAALEAAGLEVVTFGGEARIDGYTTIPDPPNTSGPLAGLMSALEFGEHRPVVTVGVDQPLLRPETVTGLLGVYGHDAVIPMDQDHPQVLCALYRPTCLPEMRQMTQVNPEASIRDLLSYISVYRVEPNEWERWGEDGRSWRSVDTPEDLAAVAALLE